MFEAGRMDLMYEVWNMRRPDLCHIFTRQLDQRLDSFGSDSILFSR